MVHDRLSKKIIVFIPEKGGKGFLEKHYGHWELSRSSNFTKSSGKDIALKL